MHLDLVDGRFDAGIHLGEFIAKDMIAVRVSADQRAAIVAAGLAFLMEEQAAPYLSSRRLVRVLEDWCEPFAGYFLYYPSRRQQPAALAAVIDMLRL